MLLELLCFGGQAGSLGLPPKTSFYFKSVKDTICPVYFSSAGVHMDGIDSFCHELSSYSHESFLESCRLHILTLQ